MADFEKKEWANRITEYPNRRVLTDVSTGTTQLNDAPFLAGHSTTIFSKKFY